MADNCPVFDGPVPYKAIEEANETLIISPPRIHDDLIKSLPFKLYGPVQIRLYQDFWFPEIILPGVLTMQKHFQSCPNDIFVISHPKSGTTWLKAVVFALMTRTSYPLDQHPLLTNNPHQCVPFVALEYAKGRSSLFDAIPSPRILSTHLPYSVLPSSITDSDCRIIYICRDPKDVLVSHYHFIYELINMDGHKAPFDEIFEMFCDGASEYGPVWDHVLGYWRESTTKSEKILFLKYEEMLQDTVEHIKRIAEFIGCPFSEFEKKQGVVEKIIELCSFQKQKNLKVNKTIVPGTLVKQISYASFFRKGLIGDWSNHMTTQMAQRLDRIAKEKFQGSGLEISEVNYVGSSSRNNM